jgi:hypothetical protein
MNIDQELMIRFRNTGEGLRLKDIAAVLRSRGKVEEQQ